MEQSEEASLLFHTWKILKNHFPVMYALWSSLKRHRSPPSNLPDPWLIASLQGSILLSDSFSSPCVATGSLMRLILITVYLYQWGSERKADTESMNFNKENPPIWSACCGDTPQRDEGLFQQDGSAYEFTTRKVCPRAIQLASVFSLC